MPNRAPIYRAKATRMVETRPNATERGYDRRWRNARASFLADHPICVRCLARGLTTEATVVDHIIPHRGDASSFWDVANWQSLCESCHNRKTATEDNHREIRIGGG